MGQPAYPGEEATRDLNIKHEWGAGHPVPGLRRRRISRRWCCSSACCLTFFCGMVGWVVWRRTGRFYLSVAAAMAAGMIARSAATDRPYLVTYAADGDHALDSGAPPPALGCCRRSSFSGPTPTAVISWAGCCSAAIAARRSSCACADSLRQTRKTLWAASLLAILASGLNPTYFNVIPGMFAYQQSRLQRTLKEWHAARALAAELVQLPARRARRPCCLWARRRARPSDVLLFAVFAALSLMAQRNVIFDRSDRAHRDRELPAGWKRPLPRMAEFAVPLALLGRSPAQTIAGGRSLSIPLGRLAVSRGTGEVPQRSQRDRARCSTSMNGAAI